MPVFPGTNCEIDTTRAFERAGGKVGVLVFRNLSPAAIEESLEAMVRGIDQAQIVMLPGGFSAGDEPEGSGKFIGAVFRNSRIRDAVHRLLRERDGLILGICNGFQALIKLGLLPYGEIRDLLPDDPTLTYNAIGRHVSCMVHTRICSTISPWLWKRQVGDIHTIPVSHGEGRFVANTSWIQRLADRGQIATQYVDLEGQATMDSLFNPNGSVAAIEGITSPDGRVFGKMGHSERLGRYVAKNVPGEKDQQIFQAGVEYFL
jgi:phosphoribosylformylglycinamidine synthase